MQRQQLPPPRHQAGQPAERKDFSQDYRNTSVPVIPELFDRDDYPFIRKDNKNYLLIEGVEYLVVDSSVSNFCDEPLACLYTGGDEEKDVLGEIALFDPQSDYAKRKYAALKQLLFEDNLHIFPFAKIQEILDKVTDFVSMSFGGEGEQKHVVKSNNILRNNRYPQCNGKPLIPFEIFETTQAGVCRHRAILNAYLVNQLIRDNLLPPGKVFRHHYRVEPRGGHAFAIYKPFRQSHLYLLDSMWFKKAYKVATPERLGQAFDRSQYSPQVVEQARKQYFRGEIYSHLSPEKKQEFRIRLLTLLRLRGQAETARKLLNQQYAEGCLPELKQDLLNLNRVRILDIDLILKTEELHSKSYNAIGSAEEQQQFIAGLLVKYNVEWSEVLKRQTFFDLVLIQNSLLNNLGDRESFVNYDAYTDLVNAVKLKKLKRPCRAALATVADHPEEKNYIDSYVQDLLSFSWEELDEIFKEQSYEDLNFYYQLLEHQNTPNYFYDALEIAKRKIPFNSMSAETKIQFLEDLKNYNERQIREKLQVQSLADLDAMYRVLSNGGNEKGGRGRIILSCIDERLAYSPSPSNNEMLYRRCLSKIRDVIASGNLIVRGFNCCFYKSGAVLNGKLRVPHHAKAIYDLIPADLDKSSLDSLKMIFNEIETIAKSATRQGSCSRDVGTWDFYYDLGNDKLKLWDLLTKLDNKLHAQNDERYVGHKQYQRLR